MRPADNLISNVKWSRRQQKNAGEQVLKYIFRGKSHCDAADAQSAEHGGSVEGWQDNRKRDHYAKKIDGAAAESAEYLDDMRRLA
ncbi:hypothetical protein LMG27198_44480 [Methylocystis echinoides]|uniref:Uncharacterized protein n=1 Tax=Methylocystis echinoides TaxID=29468 RepID=A0A9W6GYI8_9HYPH|nr:hypothetical protein LMG27198_44480 [Methylocystis echinoides]